MFHKFFNWKLTKSPITASASISISLTHERNLFVLLSTLDFYRSTGRFHRKFNLSSFARYFFFFFFLLDIFVNVKFNGGCSFFIPFDSFNFHLPFFTCAFVREKKKEERKKERGESARSYTPCYIPIQKLKLSKAFCDLG